MNAKFKFPLNKFCPTPNGIITDTGKRYSLEIEMKGNVGNEQWLVILKNPSRAGKKDKDESDLTVNRICEYFYRKRKSVSKLVIMNLFPVFETYSANLKGLKTGLIDKKNKALLKKQIKNANGIVLAWGGHPPGCKEEFDEMKNFIFPLIKEKKCYQMKHPDRKINYEKPLHGQVWGYEKYSLIEREM